MKPMSSMFFKAVRVRSLIKGRILKVKTAMQARLASPYIHIQNGIRGSLVNNTSHYKYDYMSTKIRSVCGYQFLLTFLRRKVSLNFEQRHYKTTTIIHWFGHTACCSLSFNSTGMIRPMLKLIHS